MKRQDAACRHTQVGWILLAALVVGAGVVVFAATKTGRSTPASVVLTLLIAVAGPRPGDGRNGRVR